YLQLERYPLTIYHFDAAALARCNAVIADPDCAADAIERMAACLLAAVCRPKAVACVKGRFFDRAHEKLTQLDEYQDVNPGQLDLIAHFVAAGVKLWAVGDGSVTSRMSCGRTTLRPLSSSTS